MIVCLYSEFCTQCPSLNTLSLHFLFQFNSFMAVIRDMLSRMEAEQKTKLEQIHSMQEQQRYKTTKAKSQLSVGFSIQDRKSLIDNFLQLRNCDRHERRKDAHSSLAKIRGSEAQLIAIVAFMDIFVMCCHNIIR